MSEKKNVAPVQPEEATVKKQTTGQAVEEKRSAVIYLGPSITGVAVTGTIYKNGLTPQMQKLKEELPAMGRLLVTVEHTAKMRKELRDPQSAASVCYQKTLEYAAQKGAGR